MNNFFSFSILAAGLLLALPGCSDNSTSSGAAGSATSFKCLVELTSFPPPMCQVYEASGPDAARVIESLRAGCVDQGSFHGKIVDSCPTEGNIGGCKSPVKVEGGANVQLYLTNFYYAPTGDASAPFGPPKTSAAVKQQCSQEAAGSVFVDAP